LLCVAVGVAFEFIADRLKKPLERIVETARKLELARLHNESEHLRADNLALQNIVRPRRIPLHVKKIEELRQFSGTRLFIQSVPDWEARTLEQNIAWVMSHAGWKSESVGEAQTLLSPVNINDGMRMYSPGFEISHGKPTLAPVGTRERTTYEAAQSLSKYLREFGVDNSVQSFDALPAARWVPLADAIMVVIGAKPAFAKIMMLQDGLQDG
jgi:hypothetical protein